MDLGVNIDHIATIRQARGTNYPSVLDAALLAEKAGADSITLHLREDRRHMQDKDLYELKPLLKTKMNLELAPVNEMLKIALDVLPEDVCLVPERREEKTTEGGLDLIKNFSNIKNISDDKHVEHFCSELGWREFSYSQLYYNPDLPRKSLQSKFDAFPWREDTNHLHAWQAGRTGIPMVDAGMRELWQTGYMHNRVRMIVGSFLVKNLRLDWRHGESWFWDTLVDADLANNSASWQWIAGCGADAAPYFRIFNPVTQGHKFDPDGIYIRKYIPEIASLPNKYLFSPWEASETILKQAGIELGSTYPRPIVDLKESRELALTAFKSLKQEGL